jgi:hypothetical protein
MNRNVVSLIFRIARLLNELGHALDIELAKKGE